MMKVDRNSYGTLLNKLERDNRKRFDDERHRLIGHIFEVCLITICGLLIGLFVPVDVVKLAMGYGVLVFNAVVIVKFLREW